MIFCSGHFTATEKGVVFIELQAGWALEMVWMFWRWDSSLASAKMFIRFYFPLAVSMNLLLADHNWV